MGPIACVILLIVTNLVEAIVWNADGGNIIVGAGYSSDKEQIVPERCYNATVSSTSSQQGVVQLGVAQSFSDLQTVLGVTVTTKVGFWIFSAEAKASYLRSIQDKEYSISLNYYQYATNNLAVELGGYGEEALNEKGREHYKGGKNPYFGVFCGDKYIGSYQQGALLTMGLSIEFSSSNAKNEFSEKAGATFGDIVSAAESVQKVVTENKINGSVTMHAYQMGGEPNRLANILTNDSSGQYYALACSLTAMDKCIKAASGLLDYAKHDFSSQFSTENNTGLTPLGIAFTEFVPMKYAGLTPSPSLVTPEIAQYRNQLFNKLKENQYYQQKLYPFFNKGYPVELDAGFLKNATSVLSKANANVGMLMQPHGGAADCYNFPDECKNIKAGIDSQLQNITADDLQFLKALKYTITTRGGVFHNTARHSAKDTDLTMWHAVPENKPGKESLTEVKDLSVTEETYSYVTVVKVPQSPPASYIYNYSGNLTESLVDGSMTYVGNLYYNISTNPKVYEITNYTETKLISPFFFDAYSISKQSLYY